MKEVQKIRVLLADMHRARNLGVQAVNKRDHDGLQSALIGMETVLMRLRLLLTGHALAGRSVVQPMHIDATPDGNYALRILKHYREHCNSKWTEDLNGTVTNPLLVEMNKTQDLRAAELDEAIRLLQLSETKS